MNFRFRRQKDGSIHAFDAQSNARLATYKPGTEAWECILNAKAKLSPENAEAMDAAFGHWLDKEIPTTITTPEPYEPGKTHLSPSDVTYYDSPNKPTEWTTSHTDAVPPCPEPDGISGTSGIDYMLWHALHGTDEQLTELYADRIANKPSFLPWIASTPELAPFLARIKKIKLI
jgi:hypothetical protein